MLGTFTAQISKSNNLRCPSGEPYVYHIFFFEQEPLSVWRESESGNLTEFIELAGWHNFSPREDFRSDIDSCVSSITAFYHELPITILEMLERFAC